MDAQTTYQTIENIKPENIWANYDDTSDSLIVYITGKPVPSSVDWLDNLTGVLLDDNDTVVGFQIDHFERSWLPSHGEVAKSWPAVRRSMINESWSGLLRLIATAIFILMMHFNQDDNHIALSPA